MRNVRLKMNTTLIVSGIAALLQICLWSETIHAAIIEQTLIVDVQESDIVRMADARDNQGDTFRIFGDIVPFFVDLDDTIITHVEFVRPILLRQLATGFYSNWGSDGIEILSVRYLHSGAPTLSWVDFTAWPDVLDGTPAITSLSGNIQTGSHSIGVLYSPFSTGKNLTDSFVVLNGLDIEATITSVTSAMLLDGYDIWVAASDISVVPEPLAPPVAAANGPYTLYAGDNLTLDASGSTDDANDITSYVWDLDDDGVFETDAGTEAIIDVSYAYLESLGLGIGAGYNIHLKVTDGDEQADTDTTTLTIEPKPALVIAVDIKPQSSPNPFNVNSKGVLPVAILGTEEFDVDDIDIDSIQLAGVSPIRSNYEDVATGLVDPIECECSTEGPDGYIDLTLKFEIQAIADALGEAYDGEEFILYLTGYLYDGTAIEGSDCIIIRRKGRR